MEGQHELDENTTVLYNWYNTLEWQLYGGDEVKEPDQNIIA